MSRAIDKLAQPAEKKKMRLIVASCSRTGTLGLHEALEMLGYTPYHMIDVMYKGKKPHMKVFSEGIMAHHNRFSGIKRYETAELEKWVSEYDCLLEIPSYIGPRSLEGYAADPDVKFIVTERSPIKWAKSMNNTVGAAIMLASKFPMNILRRCDAELAEFWHLADLMYWAYSDSTNPGDPNNEEILTRNYVEYIETIKGKLPKDRLLVVKLEDGLGWEQICPFLGLPIPEQKYPRGNDPDTFKKIVEDYLQPRVTAAMLKLGTVVTTVGITGFLGWRYFR
ncbi:P-loop containing nucleoside triphosphate hydrolase protein [Aspergillus floccosus]